MEPPEDEPANDLFALKSFDIIAINQGAENRFVELLTAYLEEGSQPITALLFWAEFFYLSD